jgi:hypothetical protein
MRGIILKLIIGFLALPYFAYSQQSIQSFSKSLGASFHQSAFFPSKHTDHLFTAFPWGIELEYLYHAWGTKDWEKFYNLPSWGAVFSYYDYQNPQLGKMYALSSVFNYPMIRFGNNNIHLTGALGLAYTPAQHDVEENYTNHAIGSPVSFIIEAGMGYEQALTQNITFKTQLKMVHFSNGGLAVPNMGLNMLQGNIGMNYYFQPKEAVSGKTDSVQTDPQLKKLALYVYLGGGGKAVRPFDSAPLAVYSASVLLQKQIAKVSMLSFGVEAFSGPARKKWAEYEIRISNIANGETKETPDHRLLGLAAGHELMIGDFSVVAQLGYYFYKPNDLLPDFYQRSGLKYYGLDKKLVLSMLVKTHGYGASDSVELGMGLQL